LILKLEYNYKSKAEIKILSSTKKNPTQEEKIWCHSEFSLSDEIARNEKIQLNFFFCRKVKSRIPPNPYDYLQTIQGKFARAKIVVRTVII